MDAIIIAISYLLMIVGVIGTILPALPGLILVLMGIIIYGWHIGFDVLGYSFLTTMVLLTIIGTFVDILGSMVGAKKYGASKLSILSMVVGLVFGFFTLGLPGLIIGPAVAVIFTEMFKGKSLNEALKVTLGIVLGFLSGIAFRFVIGIAMTISFTIKIILIYFSV
ncbi:DUF456 domain-containing protein [Desulfitibacter alkalitolerans]|uniref:DUF456 domain-containing protein n=1 Tax=Desulfitibacter alkalitolerans TaxID=264641 RepID=UPI0004806208|nr:DUF456 domain-containing protein [Desulfitibacter alkalitolerans]